MLNDETDDNTAPFEIDLKGDLTKEQFKGKFRAKKFLSYDDHITADRAYRDILGGQNPDFARPYAKDMADTISQLSVRLTKWPKWWPEYDGGLKLRDSNVLKEVFNKAMEIAEKAIAESTEEAEEAKKDVKEEQAKRDATE